MGVKVSVAMVVKNAAATIEEALESVKGWADEIVIVDDESADNTLEIAKRYTNKILLERWT